MCTFSVFKLLFILISLAEVRVSSAGGQNSGNSSATTRKTWKDAVAYCSLLNGNYHLIGFSDYTDNQIIKNFSANTVEDQSGFFWFNCHLVQNTSLNSDSITCWEGSGRVVYEEKSDLETYEDYEIVKNNDSCLAYDYIARGLNGELEEGFRLKNCSEDGLVYCMSDGSQATDFPQDKSSSTFQESQSSSSSMTSYYSVSGLTNPSSTDDQMTMTTDHITSEKQTSDPPDHPDTTSIEPQATNIGPTRDFLSSTLQGSTEAVASEVFSTVNTSPESRQSATTQLVSGLSSAKSTEDGGDHVPSQGSTITTVLRGTSISSTTTAKELSTVPQGPENPRSSTTSSKVRPPNLVSTIFKRNVSQKHGSCGTGDGFPVWSVLQCASACLGATEHPCQGYDLNRNSDGGLECVLNTGSGNAHSECDFFKYM